LENPLMYVNVSHNIREKLPFSHNIREKLTNFDSNKPSEFWKLWHSLNINSSNPSTLIMDKFESYFTNQVKPPNVNYFDKSHMAQIESLVNNLKCNPPTIPEQNLSDEICNGSITEEEIKTHILKLKLKKASGTDAIPGEFIKAGIEKLKGPLHGVINYLFDTGEWPDIWAEGLISPIHKKGSINIEDNYRKVTVMSAVGKVFESILNSRLTLRNLVLDMDDKLQFGFKNDARTTDNMFILNSLIQRQRLKNKPLYVCFVDFTKAFDYINRSALYYKLLKRGIHGKLLNIIMSMFDKAKCKVKWKGVVGGEIGSEFGVLQGGMLSPKLFTEFLTDLHKYLSQECGVLVSNMIISYILFADDLILCSETPEGLQKLIDGLLNYCSKWHLILSLTKTKVMIFNAKKNSPTNYKFTFNNDEIGIVTEYKYVGTVFSTMSTSCFKTNTSHLIEKARKATFGLNAYVKNSIGFLPPHLAIKMFDKQIRPILDYASEIWFSGNVKPSTCTPAVYAESGRFPLVIKQKIQALKYWKRLLESDNKSAIKNAYNSLLESYEFGQANWCNSIRDILINSDMGHIWENQVITAKDIISISNKLHETHVMNTIGDIFNSEKYPKLRTLKTFKQDFRQENYLSTLENQGHRIALTKFRLSSHNLKIETGRYESNPRVEPSDRLCIFCDKMAVENEQHFLLTCPLYTDLRINLNNTCLEEISGFQTMTNNDKFIAIMKNKNVKVISALGKFVYLSMNKRREVSPTEVKNNKKSKKGQTRARRYRAK